MKKFYITALIIAAFVMSSIHTPEAVVSTRNYPTGMKILIYYDDNDAYSTDYEGFEANYTAAGNTVTIVTQSNWNFTTNASQLATYDMVLMSQWGAGNDAFNKTTNTEVQSLVTWFATGDKLLWVGADSDFAGDWVANKTNPLLAAIGTNFRFDAGAIADAESNDQASYRVVANETGVASTYVTAITTGFTEMVFHGPTSINYWNGAKVVDARNATLLTGEEIVINSSAAAEALDQDTAVGADDFYAYSNVTGNYPMLVVDRTATSQVVLSGERVFSDYKNMYGNSKEKDKDHHDGDTIVDAIIHEYFVTQVGKTEVIVHNRYITNTVTATVSVTTTQNFTENVPTTVEHHETIVTTSTESSSPLTLWAPLLALSFVTLVLTRRKK